MVSRPRISIVIPTFNSEKTLRKTLESIKKQRYPKNKIEVLIIDGGSQDRTLEIARRYHYRILSNPRGDLIFAKHIGFMKATGKYLMSLDSDEVMRNTHSIELKIRSFSKNKNVKSVMSSGLETPAKYSEINYYINDFGDPFSYFVYKLSQNPKFYSKQLSKIAVKVAEDKDCTIFDLSRAEALPIIEPTGAGGVIDLKYARSKIPELKKNLSLVTLIFYILNKKGGLLGVTKSDPIIHYSSGSVEKYLKKISSRVKNNVFQTEMGRGGFSGREQFIPANLRYKKYLFLPYSFSIILPFLDSLSFVITRKRTIYLIHPLICLYTSISILYYSFLKFINLRPTIRGYGN